MPGSLRARAAALLLAACLAPGRAAAQSSGPVSPKASALAAGLFTGSFAASLSNRVAYNVNARGEFGLERCCDFGDRGVWPRGTFNQYIYNSGLQVSGIIGGSRAMNPWAGDTTAGMFFDASGLRQHGTGVTEVFNALLPADAERWPDAARVPSVGQAAEWYETARRGGVSASEGDLWWLAWEGDPNLNAARPHPLGIVVEYRVMGWNAPRGNEDILYVLATFHNISARTPSAYANHRPGLRELLAAQAEQLHVRNEEKFGIDLPDAGWTIEQFHAAQVSDPDVTFQASLNFSSVNLPLAMSMAWHADFPRAQAWTFPADIFGPPFFAGSGIVGQQVLRGLDGTRQVQLYSGFTGGGAFPDPNSAVRAFKYHAGAITPADGVACNQGDPLVSHICFINQATPTDLRSMISVPGIALAPGASATMVYAYVHAAPVDVPGYQRGTRVFPGNPLRLMDAAQLATGANLIDSIAGFAGYVDDDGDGVVDAEELRTVRGSLLAKAQFAQAVFESRFAAPVAPAAPEFFLVPGDGEVTVVWRPSPTEATGDPYFAVASEATTVQPGGGPPVPNPLYDPNYRQFDVEGYRLYRGRTDAPSSMQLIAQYDYAGTVFRDHTGQVNRLDQACAPEVGIDASCAGLFDPPGRGVQLTRYVEHPLSGSFVQVALGDRFALPNGDVFTTRSDTAVTGAASGLPPLADSGVPFVHLDLDVRNGLEYFYAVTAFDVNAINATGPGRTSLESVRVPRAVTPRPNPSNRQTTFAATTELVGRAGALVDDVLPTIDPVTGRLSKRMPPANGASLLLGDLVPELLEGSGEVALVLDSIAVEGFAAASSVDAVYHLRAVTPHGTSTIAVPIRLSATTGVTSASGRFEALRYDPARVAANGGSAATFGVGASFALNFPGGYYATVRSRGCVNRAPGFPSFGSACSNNGPRWFIGTSPTTPDPNASNPDRFNTGLSRVEFNNVGRLPGVRVIHEPRAYDDYSNTYRDVEAVLMPFLSAADYAVHWGAGGTIDSVIDLTHDVAVPFAEQLGASWGILNAQATQNGASYFDQRSTLTTTDAGCLEPLRTLNPGGIACTGPAAALGRTVVPGPVAYSSTGATTGIRNAQAAAGLGFVLYLKGHLFLVELEGGVPPEGTLWTLRDYVGAIAGGNGRSGDGGPYSLEATYLRRPFSAVGAAVRFRYDVERRVEVPTEAALARVHPVPDPYYAVGPFSLTAATEPLRFVNLPDQATIRIYTTSGVLVRVLEHRDGSGEASWDLRSRSGRFVAGGVYFYHVSAPGGGAAVGRLTLVSD